MPRLLPGTRAMTSSMGISPSRGICVKMQMLAGYPSHSSPCFFELTSTYWRPASVNTELPHPFSDCIVVLHQGHVVICFISSLLASGFQSSALTFLRESMLLTSFHTHQTICWISPRKYNSRVCAVKVHGTLNLMGLVKLSLARECGPRGPPSAVSRGALPALCCRGKDEL